MKKFIIILVVLISAQTTSVMGQVSDVVNFTAILQDVLSLNVTGGQDQTADFDTPDEYNAGIEAVGTTTITVESTANWYLQINANDFVDGFTNSIPINNLGVWCAATGAHAIGTEVDCSVTTLATALGLSSTDQTLLDNYVGGPGNGGDATDNAFNLNWTMGTMQNATMNTSSIFEQVSDGTIGALGTYTTTVNLTLTAY